MESAEVARIATTVILEYGVPLSVVGLSFAPRTGWIVKFSDVYSGGQRRAIDTRCAGDTSSSRFRESLKANSSATTSDTERPTNSRAQT